MTQLDDATAIQILHTIGRARLGTDEPTPAPTSALHRALAAAFPGVTATDATEGDLARAALAVLAEDPHYAEPIRMMAEAGATWSPTRFTDPITMTAVVTLAVMVLKTRMKARVDSTGAWSVEAETKPLADAALKQLIAKLLALLPPH